MKKTHLSLDDRITIVHMLSEQCSFKQIALAVGKNCTSISREVRNHILFRKTGGYGRHYNACLLRKDCSHSTLCPSCLSSNRKRCSFCDKCNANCPDFQQESCGRLLMPPYVCNGCPDRRSCTLENIFIPLTMHIRSIGNCFLNPGPASLIPREDIRRLDSIVSPLIFRGQSLNHICANNRDSLMVSESTLYRLVDYNVFKARNIDLPRKVRYSRRRKAKRVQGR